MTIGIYGIINKTKGKVYIGQSKKIEGRVSTHFQNLKRGGHSSEAMQRDYNSGDAFEWEILEEVESRNDLSLKEDYWISRYDAIEKGYNQKSPLSGWRGRVIRQPLSSLVKVVGEPVNYELLALYVQDRRQKAGLSQVALAKQSCISRNYVVIIERGEAKNISAEILIRLGRALGTTGSTLCKVLSGVNQ